MLCPQCEDPEKYGACTWGAPDQEEDEMDKRPLFDQDEPHEVFVPDTEDGWAAPVTPIRVRYYRYARFDEDPVAPARGISWGVLFGFAIWLVILAVALFG